MSNLIPLTDFRRADISDAEITFSWAANSVVRKYALAREIITWDSHLIWFTGKLADPSCFYYILEVEKKPVGSIRFDRGKDDTAVISYLIDPAFHGYGFGKLILELGIEDLKANTLDITAVIGYVLEGNKPSIHIFNKLGFRSEQTDNSIIKFIKNI